MTTLALGLRSLVLSIGVALTFGIAAAEEEGAPAAAPFRCRDGEIRGVPPADAQTAVELVCEAIERRAGSAAGPYEVSVRSLGQQIILTVSGPGEGLPVTVQLEAIEEVSTSAARIAETVATGHPLETTQRVDNLLESEAYSWPTKNGAVQFSIGVGAFAPVGYGGSGADFSIGLAYATAQVALPFELRFGGTQESDGREASFIALSAGGRRYLSKRNTSPFVGGGLSVLRISAAEGRYDASRPYHFDGELLGVAPYVEAGVEVLRLHRARMALRLHVDLPLKSVESEAFSVYSWDSIHGETVLQVPAERRYIAPATLGVTLAF
jgi:hypothetical protein